MRKPVYFILFLIFALPTLGVGQEYIFVAEEIDEGNKGIVTIGTLQPKSGGALSQSDLKNIVVKSNVFKSDTDNNIIKIIAPQDKIPNTDFTFPLIVSKGEEEIFNQEITVKGGARGGNKEFKNANLEYKLIPGNNLRRYALAIEGNYRIKAKTAKDFLTKQEFDKYLNDKLKPEEKEELELQLKDENNFIYEVTATHSPKNADGDSWLLWATIGSIITLFFIIGYLIMRLKKKERKAPLGTQPVSASNDSELKKEIQRLKEENQELSDKVSRKEAKLKELNVLLLGNADAQNIPENIENWKKSLRENENISVPSMKKSLADYFNAWITKKSDEAKKAASNNFYVEYLEAAKEGVQEALQNLQIICEEQTEENEFTHELHQALKGTDDTGGLTAANLKLQKYPDGYKPNGDNFFETVFVKELQDAVSILFRLEEYSAIPAVRAYMDEVNFPYHQLNQKVTAPLLNKMKSDIGIRPVTVAVARDVYDENNLDHQAKYKVVEGLGRLAQIGSRRFADVVDGLDRYTVYDIRRVGFIASDAEIKIPIENEKTEIYLKEY